MSGALLGPYHCCLGGLAGADFEILNIQFQAHIGDI